MLELDQLVGQLLELVFRFKVGFICRSCSTLRDPTIGAAVVASDSFFDGLLLHNDKCFLDDCLEVMNSVYLRFKAGFRPYIRGGLYFIKPVD